MVWSYQYQLGTVTAEMVREEVQLVQQIKLLLAEFFYPYAFPLPDAVSCLLNSGKESRVIL